MNNLSWLLYAADVLGSLKALFVLAAIGCGIFSAIWMIAWGVSYADDGEDSKVSFVPIKFPIAVFAFAVVSCLMPSANTVYLIAGSQASQVAVNSEIGRKVLAGVEKAIDSYTVEAVKKN